MHENAPPIKVWAYSGSTILILLLLFFSFAYSGFGPYAKILEKSNENLEKALLEINKDTSAISIVFLGSSLMEDAIEPRALEEAIFKLTGKKVNILRVAIYFLDVELIKRIDFFKYIAMHPPEYLFLENFSINLVEETTFSSNVPEQINTTLFYFRNAVRNKLGMSGHDDYYVKWYSFDTNPTPDFYLDDFDSITYKRLLNGRTNVRQISQNAVANEAYEVLQKKGTKVVFLDMPHTSDFQKNFLDEKGTAELDKLLEFYKQQYDVGYWPFTGRICDSCYIDGIHLNYKGSPQYQEWFAKELASRM